MDHVSQTHLRAIWDIVEYQRNPKVQGTPEPCPACADVPGPQSENPERRAIVGDFDHGLLAVEPLSYQWLRDSVPLPEMTTSRLRLEATTLADNGARFSVQVSNPHGTVTSAEASLVVSRIAAVPVVVQSPAEQWVVAGNAAVFAVTVTGSDPILYQWQRNGTSIPNATDRVLTLNNVNLADDGAIITVTASNPAGTTLSAPAMLRVTQKWPRSTTEHCSPPESAMPPAMPRAFRQDSGSLRNRSHPASLTVNPPSAPTIVQAPRGTNLNSGQAALFGVYATGNGLLLYQWLRDGGTIAGATSPILDLPALVAVADHCASFSVQVSNAGGTVSSAPAFLRVDERAGVDPASTPCEHTVFGQQVPGDNNSAAGSIREMGMKFVTSRAGQCKRSRAILVRDYRGRVPHSVAGI